MSQKVKINPTYIEVKVSSHVTKWEQSRGERYWEYRRKWKDNPESQIIEDFPLHLDIEASRRCNLRCPMCPRTIKILKGEKLYEGDISFELFKKVVDEGAEKNLYSIKFSYLGEPLICDNLARMVSYAKEKKIVDTMLNTNATLLTEEKSEELIRSGIDQIFISFDSPIKENYEQIRIGASFEKVINNMKRLVQLRKDLNSITPIIRTSMTVMKENKDQVLDYIKLWVDIVDLIGFGDYLNPQGLDTEDRYAFNRKKREEFICPQPYQRLFVHWDGRIGLCCVDYDGELNLGNVKDTKIADVWKGDKLNKVRELHKQGNWHKVPLCAKCHHPYVN